MTDHPLNPKTTQALSQFLANPSQAVGLVGQTWLNKGLIAISLAEDLLQIKPNTLDNYPYVFRLGGEDLPSITIDEIRSINSFLMLKVPLKTSINRIVLIDNSERMTLEAQNAILKNLEEPPSGTIFILSVDSLTSLLPTIISRLTTISVYKPDKDSLDSYFKKLGCSSAEINQAFLIADGLPGLMEQLLLSQDNPFSQATDTAKKVLTSSTFERLSLINDLSKDKIELKNTLFVIKQMAKIGISSKETKSSLRWQRILSATLDSEDKLRANVQVKLLLNDYMLSLR